MSRALTIVLCLIANVVFAQSDSQTEHATPARPIIVSVSTDRTRAYLNEQILLSVTLQVREEAFGITGNQPTITNASIISLHKQEYTEKIAGETYNTTKRTYAVFAEKTGKLSLAPIAYRAQLPVSFDSSYEPEPKKPDPDKPNPEKSDPEKSDPEKSNPEKSNPEKSNPEKSNPEKSNPGKPTPIKANPKVSATSTELELTILPAGNTAAVWLPAANVSLAHSWLNTNDESSTTARAGEPLKFQIEVQIRGQHPTAVPPVQLPDIENLRLYSEPPEWTSEVTPTGVTGSITQTLSVIGSHAGDIVFPGVHIDWWDINAQKWRTAATPADTLRILPALVDAPGPWINQGGYSRNEYWQDELWRAVLVVAGLLLALAVSLYFQHSLSGARPAIASSEASAWRNVMRCVKRCDPESLRSALEAWSTHQWPRLLRRPCTDSIQNQNADLGKIMALLNQHLYSNSNNTIEDWAGLQRDLSAIRRELKKSNGAIERSVLANLYPQAQA